MVKIMENPIKMDDFGGTPIFGNIQVTLVLISLIYLTILKNPKLNQSFWKIHA